MNKFILFFLLLFPIVALAQKPVLQTSNIDSLLRINKTLESKIKRVESNIADDKELDEKYYSSISNQLSSASYSITIFGILFSIAAIGLGIYVTYVERKILKIKEENLNLLQQTIKVKNEVVELNHLIQSDISGLFLKIKKEETAHIIERLINIPEDINNVSSILVTRELASEDFVKLKLAFNKIEDKNYYNHYITLFFQHFADLSLNDEITKPYIIQDLPFLIDNSFKNDILKSTEDLFGYFVNNGLLKNKDTINAFLSAFSISKFKNLPELYELIFNKLRNRTNQFLLLQILESKKELETFKITFGNLLKSEYSIGNLSESEKLILMETNK